MCTDALDSSEIEGEHLNRDSVQSFIQKELGFAVGSKLEPIPMK